MPKLNLIETPNGRFHFVGNVPASLALMRKDGQPLTDEDIENGRHVGVEIARLKTRSWPDKYSALADAVREGFIPPE